LLRTTRDFDIGINSASFFLQRQLLEPTNDDDDDTTNSSTSSSSSSSYMYGAGFNGSGYSKASIYYISYTWYNDTTLVFNYYYLYAFRRFSGLTLYSGGSGNSSSSSSSSSSNHDTTTPTSTPPPDQTNFLIPPYGAHASHWKTISVMVCNSASISQPLAVRYDQGTTQSQITSCTMGECVFYKDTYHPVGFVALESHSIYPISAQTVVLDILQVDSFSNLQNVLAVDRTVYRDTEGQYRFFYPNATNVIRYKDQSNIQFNVSNSTDYWQGFAGSWGDANLSNYDYHVLSYY
jgi:hypothetical protein